MTADSAERQGVSVPRYTQRFDCDTGDTRLAASTSGEWVRYADVQPLLAEIERLRGEVATYRAALSAAEHDMYAINKRAEAQVEAMREALLFAERHCPCGARPESLKTHPHVGGGKIAAALLAGASGGG